MISLGGSAVRGSRAHGVVLVSSLVVLPGLLGVACSEGDLDPNTVMAGTTSTGGTQTGNAGSSGAPGNGGTTNTGNGGSTSGGSGGAGPSGPTETLSFTTGLEGFRVNWYCSGPPAAVEPGTNCFQLDAAPPVVGDAGSDAATDAAPAEPPPFANEFVAVSHDTAEGSPEAGSARLAIQFAQAGQQVQFAYNTPNTDEGALDLTGKTVTALVRADVAGATAKMYLKSSGTYIYADAGQVALVAGMWTTLTFVANTPAFNNPGYNANDIREMGISFETVVTAPTPIVINVDTVRY